MVVIIRDLLQLSSLHSDLLPLRTILLTIQYYTYIQILIYYKGSEAAKNVCKFLYYLANLKVELRLWLHGVNQVFDVVIQTVNVIDILGEPQVRA